MKDDFIERRIVTGLIVSTEYIQEIRPQWNSALLDAAPAKLIAGWCIEYFDKYNRAPKADIEGIYAEKLVKENLSKTKGEDIEEILSGLSVEYERDQFNVSYLLDQTRPYFREQRIRKLVKEVSAKLTSDALMEAEQLLTAYSPTPAEDQYNAIDPFASAQRFRKAFEENHEPLIVFPKKKLSLRSLAEFWNDQMVRDGFVAIMGAEKKGKTFMMIELGMMGMASGCNIAFFQAGDMTENQQLRRLGIYLAKRSDKERYCKELWVPEVDCMYNQLDECPKSDLRTVEHKAIFDKKYDIDSLTQERMIHLYQQNPKYKSCAACRKLTSTIWLRRQDPVSPLTWKEAYKEGREWQKRHNKRFKLCTYPNETLTVSEIKSLLNVWERRDGFVPDVILIDYADILAPDADCTRLDFRHQQNKLWQRLRRLSEERHCLLVTATQAAASSYDKDTLSLSDFSEDKRKYAHVTAMFGLNQKPEEKRLGIMRLNKLVVREDDFIITDQVRIIQRLQIGRPFLGCLN